MTAIVRRIIGSGEMTKLTSSVHFIVYEIGSKVPDVNEIRFQYVDICLRSGYDPNLKNENGDDLLMHAFKNKAYLVFRQVAVMPNMIITRKHLGVTNDLLAETDALRQMVVGRLQVVFPTRGNTITSKRARDE